MCVIKKNVKAFSLTTRHVAAGFWVSLIRDLLFPVGGFQAGEKDWAYMDRSSVRDVWRLPRRGRMSET